MHEISRQMTAPASRDQLARRELVGKLLPFIRDFYNGYLPEAAPEPFYRGSARQ